MKIKCAFIAALVLVLLSVPATAQVSTGSPWLGSFSGGPDVINLGNLNANSTFPLINKAGRGIPFTIAPSLDSSIWYPVKSNNTTSWQPLSTWGWSGLPGGTSGNLTYTTTTLGPYSCGPPPWTYPMNPGPTVYSFTVTQYSNYVYTDPRGTQHAFPSNQVATSSVSGQCFQEGIPYYPTNSATGTDGTGYSITAYPGSGKVSNPQGIGVTFSNGYTPSYQEDVNGNYISCTGSSCTDTLGTTAMTIAGNAASPPMVLTVPGPGQSGNQNYIINYTNYTVQTAFNCPSVHEFGPTVEPLISSILLPDGTSYQFSYEELANGNYTGRIKAITIPSDPSGPTITYSYSGGDAGTGIYCADGSTPNLTRTTPDGTWTYSRSGSGTQWTTTVNAPPGSDGKQDQTLIAFYEAGSNFYEIGREAFSGSTSSGSLLQTTLTCYQTSPNPSACPTSYSAAVAVGGTNFALSGHVVTNQFPNSAGISSGYSDVYQNGVSINHTTYDFGAAGSGTFSSNPLQIHATSYLFYSSSIYDSTTGVSIVYPPAVQIDSIVNGSSTPWQALTYVQNNYGQTATVASGAPHRSNGICASGTACAFNLTSTYKWVSGGNPLTTGIAGTNYQTTTYKDFDTGLVNVATDVNGGTTTYAYNGSGGCGDAFPTSVTSTTGGSTVTSLQTSATWNCNGGVQLTSVDVNGNTTTNSYGSDPLWRVMSVTNNATGAVTNYTYPTPWSKMSSISMNFNGGSSTSTSVTSYDRLGRAVLQQKQQGPNSSNYDTVAISYDQRGRANFQTLPYQGTQGQIILSNPGITTQFDALNRMTQVTDGGSGTVTYTYSGNDTLVATGPAPSGENLKQRSLQYNGAGWLSSVCEIVMSTQPAGKSCGQTTNPNGYLTTYAYNSAGWLTQVKQNAQPGSSGVQTRTISYDGLGRKLSETIPEWSAGTGLPGTTYYTYDSASSCSGSSTGDLIKSVDNAGNVTCLTYDSLHRPLSSTVVSGPYASVTPVMNYVYDAATYNGTAMQNAQGNLAEAYTGASSSKITDLYFSKTYGGSGATAGGTVSQVWESTPHSAGYFLTTDTYYPNGALGLRTASYGVPSLSYGLDGEGRPNAATDSTYNLNLVTAASYNPASAATGVSYGNGDSDAFGYDSMNRPNSIAYNVGGSNPMISNALTWNANSSLKSMQVTDNNDTTKSQNCTYSADDLSRIASANCVNKGVPQWAQTFAYDPFGNINKTGNPGTTYSAAYSSVTNQVSGGPSYDANGNQMNSTPANLTWNALNQPITVNSTTATYDALGRMVEKGAGGTYTQFVYCIEGAVLAVYSGGLVKGTIPLPGGGTAVYNANGLNFIRHKDWLGSSRLATTWAHAVYSKEAYAPFGETYNEAGTPDRSFTGQDQDVATGSGGTGVYDFLFRKYDPSAGRWLSPDPAGWGAVSQTVPQSLNRYAYVMNQPMIAVDPAGLILCVSADGTPFDSGYDGCPNDSTSYNEVDSVTVNGDDNPTVPLTPNACNTSDIICQIQYQDFVSGMTYAQFVLQRSNTNALNNAWAYEKKAIICNFQAEGAAAKEGGVSLALDAVGFIPGEGLLNFAAQTGVGLVSTVISANKNDAFGAQSSLAGTFLMFAGTVYKSGAVGKAIPILGIGVNTIATLHDLGTTISAGWNAVNACMSQP